MLGEGKASVRAGVVGAGERGRGVGLPSLRPLQDAARSTTGSIGRSLGRLLACEAAAFDTLVLVTLALGLGVVAYFAAPEEPSLAAPLATASVLAALSAAARRHRPAFLAALAATCLATGFTVAKLRTMAVAAPVLPKPVTARVNGLVLGLDPRAEGGARLLVRPAAIAGIGAPDMPGRIRVTARSVADIAPGDAIAVTAALRPPSAPVVPGGFDFARDAFFDGIGAVGFTVGTIERLEPGSLEPDWSERFRIFLDLSRNALTERIATTIGGENGAVAASQVTGKRSLIPEEANEALRAAGLYHVVSISGLHMALFAGALFWLIRAGLALSPRLALETPLKTVAALLSLAPAAAYTIFSGAEVATLRAFLMTAVVLVAVALERDAVTRRNVALAACAVMATTPDELIGPSFQMSFAAVAVMVAWYERARLRRPGLGPALGERAGGALLGAVATLVATTVLASLATAPFAAYHFHRLTLQSLAANLLATPIVTGLIMPLSLLALLLEPFGYGGPAWAAVGTAVGWFMAIARLVASWPGSDLIVPQAPPEALAALSLAVILVAVLRTRLASVAALPAAAGILWMASAERPVAIIGANGHAALIRDGTDLHLIAASRDAFAAREWLLAMGDGREPGDATLKGSILCDGEGCSAPLASGERLMLDKTVNAVDEDCGRAAVLVSPLVVPSRCRSGRSLVVDRTDLSAAGSIAIYAQAWEAEGSGFWRVVRAREPGIARPWTGRPAAPPAGALAPASEGPSMDAEDAEGRE